MKQLFTILIFAFLFGGCALAYDFSAVCESGQTLYYNITSNTYTVELIHQNISEPYYDINPVGNLVIPENVTFNDVIYSVTSIADSTFYNCSELTSVIIPNSVIRIGNMAFGNCRGLVSVTIPESVERIDNWAFRDCRVLATVNFNATNCTIMGSEGYPVFQNCYANTTINIGNSVTIIPHYAFMHAKGNGALYIPNSVTYIGNWAFYDCNRFTSVVIGSSVSEIGSYAFLNCSNLESIMVDTENNVYDSRDNCNAVIETSTNNLVVGCRNSIIPSSVTSIGEFAFQNCRLTSVFIPNSVTRIGEGAFDSCIELAEVNMGDSVIDIGDFAFAGCNGLTNLTMSNSVVNIGNNAFSTCYNLISVTLPNSLESIGDYAFQLCSGIISLTIPNSVTNIGEWAFYNCTGLTSVMISNSITEIKRSTFENCRGLISVAIPNSVNNIGECAFKNCSSITTLVIPNSVTEIIWGAFEGCSGMTSVTIPHSITYIGDAVFEGCSGLTTIDIPNSVTEIGYSSFQGCSSLTTVSFPRSVTTIGWNAFANCSGLTSVKLPSSVIYINEQAFNDCVNINAIYSFAVTPPEIGSHTFDWDLFYSYNNNVIVYVPCEAVDNYESANYWSNFRNIQGNRDQMLDIESADSLMGIVNIVETPDCENRFAVIEAIANEGYAFLEWNDGSTDNPRTIEVISDTTFIAIFAVAHNVAVETSDSSTGMAMGSGIYAEGAVIQISAIPNEGYAFLEWNDGSTDNPRTVEIISDTTFIAIFDTARTITIESSNSEMGYVIGGGVYAEGAVVEITAVPYEGYRFDHWVDVDNPTRDYNAENPRTILVSGDVTYIAVFESEDAIEDYIATEIALFPNPATDILNITSSETISEIEIVNALGQVVYRAEVNADNAVCDVEGLMAGVYIVRIHGTDMASVCQRKFIKE